MSNVNIILDEEQREGTTATVAQWLIKEGDFIEINQPIVELETDKVMMEIIAPASGILTQIKLNPGDEIYGKRVLGVIDSSIKKINTTQIEKKIIVKEEKPKAVEKSVLKHTNTTISPAVRRLIQQNNIDVTLVHGSGKDHRITSRDIRNYLKNSAAKPVSDQSSQHIPLSSMRKSIANHMVQSLLHTAPHVTSVFNLDLTKIIEYRKAYKTDYLEQGANLTFTAFFIAASKVAIKEVPLINSQLHNDTIEIFPNINIGIGTALDDEGLIVPVLKNCQNRDLLSIAKELTRMTNKARMKKLKPDDVKGGTFTISNHGVSGSLIATPIIINQPQSAILGIGKMEKRVVVTQVDGQDMMSIKPMCYVSLTIDHRVLDAHQCNKFLSVYVETLENWT
jgi:2-oxoglutarate dehydrogenase E2 component (dihydrolipoamide succinyltransferase)